MFALHFLKKYSCLPHLVQMSFNKLFRKMCLFGCMVDMLSKPFTFLFNIDQMNIFSKALHGGVTFSWWFLINWLWSYWEMEKNVMIRLYNTLASMTPSKTHKKPKDRQYLQSTYCECTRKRHCWVAFVLIHDIILPLSALVSNSGVGHISVVKSIPCQLHGSRTK